MATKVISHEKGSFLTDIKEIRRRARQQIMEGAVTPDYRDRRMMEAILANEEEHAEDMKALLETVGKEENQRDRR